MPSQVPAWCRSVAGEGPVLVVVPHGGLCERDLLEPHGDGTLRGNDLHTGEVARLLAQRLGASLVENLAVDRNHLDLNRIDEVAARAPWFFDLLREHLERILARHATAEVLFLHGWHVVQPSCDVGIGARLASAADAPRLAPRLTTSAAYVASALERLRVLGERDGIRTTFGERWPAAHPNNVMQLFRRAPRATPSACPALAGVVASGRTHAVQLELGAPLRFPGAWRERFVASAAAAFAAPGGSVAAVCEAATEALADEAAPFAPGGPWRGVALQAHDASAAGDGLGVVAGVGPLGRDEIGGRLLLLPGSQRMLLFTGHGRRRADGRLAIGGLEADTRDGVLEVRFRGPLLDIPDAALYFRDEAAQLAARVVDADVELRFAARDDDGRWGRVEGRVRLDGTVLRLDAHGFTDPVLARLAPERPGARLRLTASFAGDLGLVADLAAEPGSSSLAACGPSARTAPELDDEAALPDVAQGCLTVPFALPLRGGAALRCAPRGHVTVLRPLRPGLLARVTFGVALYELGERRGSGFYEHTTAFACADPSERT